MEQSGAKNVYKNVLNPIAVFNSVVCGMGSILGLLSSTRTIYLKQNSLYPNVHVKWKQPCSLCADFCICFKNLPYVEPNSFIHGRLQGSMH